MSEVKWIKITTDIFDDEKIKLIETMPDADTLIVIWFKLLSLSGKCNAGGLIYLTRDIPYNVEMLSTILRRPAATIRLALTEFQKLRMIEFFNDFIQITNWEKHQDLKLLELAREKTRLRVQNHRDNQKQLCNVTVTECNGTDKIRLDKNRLDKNREEKNICENFEEWWIAYDKKRNKTNAIKVWNKLNVNVDLFTKIMQHTFQFVRSTKKQFRPDPERYLKYKRFEDEIIIEESSKGYNDPEIHKQLDAIK